jgi:hypothetical protein
VAAAVAAGVANWLRLRRAPGLAAALAAPGRPAPVHDGSGIRTADGGDDGNDGHRIFVNPWADEDEAWHDTGRRASPGPSELP